MVDATPAGVPPRRLLDDLAEQLVTLYESAENEDLRDATFLFIAELERYAGQFRSPKVRLLLDPPRG